MGKNKRFLVLLFLMLALCGCSLVNKTDNSEGEQEEMPPCPFGHKALLPLDVSQKNTETVGSPPF